jgi:acyl carrier protein
MDPKTALTDYIQRELLHGRVKDLKEDQDLLSAGIIDSLGILQLVAFMEKQLGVQVPDEDVIFENFQSIRAMTEYVAQRQRA